MNQKEADIKVQSEEYLKYITEKSREWCIQFYRILGLGFNDTNMGDSIKVLNNYIYTTIFNTNPKSQENKYILDFFQNWIIGYGKKDNRLRKIFTDLLQEIHKDLYNILDKEIIGYLESNNYSIHLEDYYNQLIYQGFFSQGFSIKDVVQLDSSFSFNQRTIGKDWRKELAKTIAGYCFKNIPSEIQIKNKKKKISFTLVKESIAVNNDKNDMYFRVNFTDEAIDYLSNMIYNFVLQKLQEYDGGSIGQKDQSAINGAKGKINTFLKDEKNIILAELRKGISDYSLNKLKNKSDFTGFYGEAINTCFLRVFYRKEKGYKSKAEGRNVTQVGANKRYQLLTTQKMGNQPPTDIYIKDFSNNNNAEQNSLDIRVQVKQWGKLYRASKGLGENVFNYYPYPKNLSYFYNTDGDPSVDLFNIIRFLIANEAVYISIGGQDLNLANPLLYTHLIPGFLRIANYVNYVHNEVNGNELFVVGGYYIPSYFILRKIQLELKNIQKNERLLKIFCKQGKESNGYEKGRGSFINILNNNSKKTKNVFWDSMLEYRRQNKNSINEYSGTFGVRFKGVDVSQKILEGLI